METKWSGTIKAIFFYTYADVTFCNMNDIWLKYIKCSKYTRFTFPLAHTIKHFNYIKNVSFDFMYYTAYTK